MTSHADGWRAAIEAHEPVIGAAVKEVSEFAGTRMIDLVHADLVSLMLRHAQELDALRKEAARGQEGRGVTQERSTNGTSVESARLKEDAIISARVRMPGAHTTEGAGGESGLPHTPAPAAAPALPEEVAQRIDLVAQGLLTRLWPKDDVVNALNGIARLALASRGKKGTP